MCRENFTEIEYQKMIKRNSNYKVINRALKYRKNHPEFKQFIMPKSFYFKIDTEGNNICWAAIIQQENKYVIYFLNYNGRAFDKLEYKNKKVAQRLLRKNKFISSNNQKCPYLPITPIYVKLYNEGKYSNGSDWIVQERYNK